MSSTGRGAVRRPDDDYATPAWCVHRLLEGCQTLREWLPRNAGDRITWLEPACGDGAIIRAVTSWLGARRGPAWLANDIRQDAIDGVLRTTSGRAVSARCGDFLTDGWTSAGTVDAVLTNPPYCLAEEFVESCLSRTAGPVAMLVRLGWLSSQERAPLLRQMPPDVYVLPDRPSFTGNGKTDSADYCWIVFPPTDEPRERPRGSFQVLATTPLAIRKPRAVRAPHTTQEI